MRIQVIVILGKGVEFHFSPEDSSPMPPDVARAWLDAQFTALECEPLRASGKVLTADKVLRVTEAAGSASFADEEWSVEYVRAVYGALGKPLIRVDVSAMAITY